MVTVSVGKGGVSGPPLDFENFQQKRLFS